MEDIDQRSTVDLASVRLWDRVDEPEATGDLPPRQPLCAELLECLGRRYGAGLGHDERDQGAERWSIDDRYRGVRDLWVVEQYIFDLRCVQLAASSPEHRRMAAGDIERTAGVEVAPVAGLDPADMSLRVIAVDVGEACRTP